MTATPVAPPPLPSRIQLLAALLGVAGILLPFSAGLSPLGAIRQHSFATVAAAAFISPLITGLALWLLHRGTLGVIARTAAWLVAAMFLLTYLRGWTAALVSSSDTIDISSHPVFGTVSGSVSVLLPVLLPVLLLLLGGWRSISAMRRGDGDRAPLLALRTMYLVNAAFALAVFASDWQVGAWCVLGAAVLQFFLLMDGGRTNRST